MGSCIHFPVCAHGRRQRGIVRSRPGCISPVWRRSGDVRANSRLHWAAVSATWHWNGVEESGRKAANFPCWNVPSLKSSITVATPLGPCARIVSAPRTRNRDAKPCPPNSSYKDDANQAQGLVLVLTCSQKRQSSPAQPKPCTVLSFQSRPVRYLRHCPQHSLLPSHSPQTLGI